MNRVRDMRGGKDYDATFGKRMHGEGIWADMIRQRFEKAVVRLGIGVRSGRFKSLDTSRFRPPSAASTVMPTAIAHGEPYKGKNKKVARVISSSFSNPCSLLIFRRMGGAKPNPSLAITPLFRTTQIPFILTASSL